ncbi:MAG: phosphomannomutase/phosphoglucomutase [Clostridiales bacterium]|nr:phosphomannomutase/phosphoglucomutase [Clostridiales bacterium]
MELKKLQNGSDIRGIALPGPNGELPNLTETESEALTLAFLCWLSKKTGIAPEDMTVSIGCDSRLSGEALKQAAADAMAYCGVKVLDCGLASTPAMFMSTVFPEFDCDGAIMVTASHLPANRNGFKYFDREGGLNKEDVSRIIFSAAYGETPRQKSAKDIEKSNLLDAYCSFLKEKIKNEVNSKADFEKPLAGLKIAVDAGSGAGGFYAADILAPLGADVSGSQYLSPDGTFPGHAPNPEDREAVKSISAAVQASGSDLGLIFDTDVDRSAAVCGHGREISRNGIVAMAAALIAEDHPGTTVVTDSITSDQLSSFLTEKLRLEHFRYKRGYKNVINKAISLGAEGVDCQLAIETSGHAAYKENYFLDDGAYLATKIVIKAAQLASEGKTIGSLIAELEEPAEAREIRLPVEAADSSSFADEALETLRQYAEAQPGMTVVAPNYEGIRISFDKEHGDGWCLLRKSLHDPLMPLNIESNSEGGCDKILRELKPVLKDKFCLEI